MRTLSVAILFVLLTSCTKEDDTPTISKQSELHNSITTPHTTASSVMTYPTSAPTAGLTPATNQLSHTIPEEVELYSRELNIIGKNPHARNYVEGLFGMGRKASKALLANPKKGYNSILESLSEENFNAVSDKMKGFLVGIQEIVVVEPEPDYFLNLAEQSDDQASVDFFKNYKKTISDTTYPVYIKQITDFGGCRRYGTMSLVHTYSIWDNYKKKYPARYKTDVDKFIHDVESEFEGTCACDDIASVIKELEAFIQAFPHAKITTRLRERVNQIRQGKGDIREHCLPG